MADRRRQSLTRVTESVSPKLNGIKVVQLPRAGLFELKSLASAPIVEQLGYPNIIT